MRKLLERSPETPRFKIGDLVAVYNYDGKRISTGVVMESKGFPGTGVAIRTCPDQKYDAYVVFEFDPNPQGSYLKPDWALDMLDPSEPCPMCAWRNSLKGL
jgi:hypothetical protein